MKKYLLGFLGLLIMGAGCLPVANKTVNGPWQLAFDLPSGWVMVQPYTVAGIGDARPLNQAVRRDDSEVYLQSTDKAICYTSGGPCAAGSVSEGEQIHVTVLDPRRKLDLTELTDLKDGFYMKAGSTERADGPEVMSRDIYYYKTDKATYQFKFSGDADSVKKIILSAELVTHFTDVPSIQVQTE